MTGLQWLASEAWTGAAVLHTPDFMPYLKGTLGIAIRRGEITGLRDFLLQIRPGQSSNNTSYNMVIFLTILTPTGTVVSKINDIFSSFFRFNSSGNTHSSVNLVRRVQQKPAQEMKISSRWTLGFWTCLTSDQSITFTKLCTLWRTRLMTCCSVSQGGGRSVEAAAQIFTNWSPGR